MVKIDEGSVGWYRTGTQGGLRKVSGRTQWSK